MAKKYNYMKDSDVKRLFLTWIQSPDPMLLKHTADRCRFFQFVKGCFSFVGRHPYGSKIDLSIFNKYLINALSEPRLSLYGDRYTDEVNENIRHEAVVLFERIIEYEDTKGNYISKAARDAEKKHKITATKNE
jgi:hypothetical protein